MHEHASILDNYIVFCNNYKVSSNATKDTLSSHWQGSLKINLIKQGD